MAGNQPARHGVNWSRHPGGVLVKRVGPAQGNVTHISGNHAEQEHDQRRVIPVDQVNYYLNALPKEQIVPQFISAEIRYNHALLPGQQLEIIAYTVEPQYTWVFTDIFYYATSPTANLQSAPQQLPPESLVGLINFSLKFGGSTPMKELARRFSPYAAPAQVPISAQGWPWLQTPFGAQRAPGGFAVYAKSQERVTVVGTVENRPRFPIHKIGVNMHGFTIPESILNEAWKPGTGA